MRPQADALGQNLPHRAISSAVEHLPYKEIVTGSIPVSPISKNQVSRLVLSNQAGLQRNPSGWWLLRPQPLRVDALALSKGLTPWKIGAGPRLW